MTRRNYVCLVALLALLLAACSGAAEPTATTAPTAEEREPTDPSDPVPHTDTQTLEALDGWCMVGASRRGKMHAHKGIYREDAFALGEANGWHLVVGTLMSSFT